MTAKDGHSAMIISLDTRTTSRPSLCGRECGPGLKRSSGTTGPSPVVSSPTCERQDRSVIDIAHCHTIKEQNMPRSDLTGVGEPTTVLLDSERDVAADVADDWTVSCTSRSKGRHTQQGVEIKHQHRGDTYLGRRERGCVDWLVEVGRQGAPRDVQVEGDEQRRGRVRHDVVHCAHLSLSRQAPSLMSQIVIPSNHRLHHPPASRCRRSP
jgi:hypothetical protein